MGVGQGGKKSKDHPLGKDAQISINSVYVDKNKKNNEI